MTDYPSQDWHDKTALRCSGCGHVQSAHVHATFDTVGCQLICCTCVRFVK